MEGKLSGKVAVITGVSSSIGVETVRALAATGATLYLTARDLAKAKLLWATSCNQIRWSLSKWIRAP